MPRLNNFEPEMAIEETDCQGHPVGIAWSISRVMSSMSLNSRRMSVLLSLEASGVSKLKNWPRLRSMIQIRSQYKLHKKWSFLLWRCTTTKLQRKDLTSLMLCASGKQWWKSRAHNITTSCELEMPFSVPKCHTASDIIIKNVRSISLPSLKIAIVEKVPECLQVSLPALRP